MKCVKCARYNMAVRYIFASARELRRTLAMFRRHASQSQVRRNGIAGCIIQFAGIFIAMKLVREGRNCRRRPTQAGLLVLCTCRQSPAIYFMLKRGSREEMCV